MATQSSIFAWRIPWTEEPGALQSIELQRVGQEWRTEHAHIHYSTTGSASACSGELRMWVGGSETSGTWKFEYNSTVASLVAQLVKNLPAMRETCVWSLGWEDYLEKGKATHSSILAWRIPCTIYIVHGVTKSRDTTGWLSLSTVTLYPCFHIHGFKQHRLSNTLIRIYWKKKSTFKWTHTAQTHVVRVNCIDFIT